MKSFRSTGILFAVVTLLAAYTFYEFRAKSKSGLPVAEGETRLFDFGMNEVEAVDVERNAGAFSIERRGDDWYLTKPVQDLADKAIVDSFLYSLVDQRIKDFVSEDEVSQVKWEDLGLDSGFTKLIVHSKGKSVSADVSSKNAFDGRFYMRVNGEPKLGDRSWAQIFQRNPESFRNKYLWPHGMNSETQSISFKYPEGKTWREVTLESKEGKWSMTPPVNHEISDVQISNWLDDLKDFKAVEVISDPGPDLSKFGLVTPRYEIHITTQDPQGEGEKVSIKISGPIAEDVYAMREGNPAVYKLTRTAAERVKVDTDYFREGQSPFQFSLELARQIEVETTKGRVKIEKDGENWKLVDGGNLELKTDKLVELFQKVRDLDAREFHKTGRGWPQRPQLVIRGKDDKILLQLEWGEKFKPTKGYLIGQEYKFVRSSQSSEVFGVQFDRIERVVPRDLVVEKPVEAETKPTESKK